MSEYHQQALDYLLGELDANEATMFERLTRQDPSALEALQSAREDLSLLGQTPEPAPPNDDLRNRILGLCQPRMQGHGFTFVSKLADKIRPESTPATMEHRYDGGGNMVDLSDVKSQPHRDFLLQTYETFHTLWPHVTGASPAAAGDLGELSEALEKLAPSFPRKEELSATTDLAKASNEPPIRSLHYSYLATLPALGYFVSRVRAGDGNVSDARRMFYLCRDQLKIMRSAFSDIDPSRLQDDKKLRIHSTDFLLRKWRGAQHSWFTGGRQIGFGQYFDGPLQTCRMEFAEYISNVYCLANLLAAKSEDKNYRIDLLQGTLPDSSLTLISAPTTTAIHKQLSGLFPENPLPAEQQTEEHYLANLVVSSVSQAAKLSGDRDALLSGRFGCVYENGRSILYFTWPELACE